MTSIPPPNLNRLLYRTNKIYFDSELGLWSLKKKNASLATQQERFDQQFTPYGYEIDQQLRVKPGAETPVIPFGDLWDLLSSSDE